PPTASAALYPPPLHDALPISRPRLTDREVHFFTHVDYDDRVALIATIGAEMVGVTRYDRLRGEGEDEAGDTAEVAFLVEDAHQGRGVGSVLLEHLGAAADRKSTRLN